MGDKSDQVPVKKNDGWKGTVPKVGNSVRVVQRKTTFLQLDTNQCRLREGSLGYDGKTASIRKSRQ